MNVKKAPRIESSVSQASLRKKNEAISIAHPSDNITARNRNSLPKKTEAKPSIRHSSNNSTARNISDQSKTSERNLSCTGVLCSTGPTKSSTSRQASFLKKNEAKIPMVQSSSTSRRTFNESCRRYLCSFGGSNSKPSNPTKASTSKGNEGEHPIPHPSHTLVTKKSVEVSSQGQPDCKDDSMTVAASPKLGAQRSSNTERKLAVAGQSDKAQLKTPIERQIQKTSGLNDSPVYNLRSRVQKTEGPKESQACNSRSKAQRTEVSKDSPVATQNRRIQSTESPKPSTLTPQKRGIPKPDGAKNSPVAIPKREFQKTEVNRTLVPKSSAPLVKKTTNTRTSTPSLTIHDKNKQPSPSQPELSYDPVFYIRWDGILHKESKLSGQKCIFCDQDLSCEPSGLEEDEYRSDDDDDSDDDFDDEYDNDLKPCLLPAVDILSCGHAFHSECLQYDTPLEHSSDPQCVICLSMV